MNIVCKVVSVGLLAAAAGGCASSPQANPPNSYDYDKVFGIMGNDSVPDCDRMALAEVLSWNLTRNPDPVAVESLVMLTSDDRSFPCRETNANGNGCVDFSDGVEATVPAIENSVSGDNLPADPRPETWRMTLGQECGEILGRILEFPHPRCGFSFLRVTYGNSWVSWWAANGSRTPEEWRAEVRQFARDHHEED